MGRLSAEIRRKGRRVEGYLSTVYLNPRLPEPKPGQKEPKETHMNLLRATYKEATTLEIAVKNRLQHAHHLTPQEAAGAVVAAFADVHGRDALEALREAAVGHWGAYIERELARGQREGANHAR